MGEPSQTGQTGRGNKTQDSDHHFFPARREHGGRLSKELFADNGRKWLRSGLRHSDYRLFPLLYCMFRRKTNKKTGRGACGADLDEAPNVERLRTIFLLCGTGALGGHSSLALWLSRRGLDAAGREHMKPE